MAATSITHDPIKPETIAAQVDSDGCGALVTFAGTVRNISRGRTVKHIDYEAYFPLAKKELERVAGEAETKFKVRAAVGHRIGRVYPGEISIVVAVASPHRAEAFDACRWLMDAVKTAVPIWKREQHENGADWIEGDAVVPATSTRSLDLQ